jgi:hypothetical protein
MVVSGVTREFLGFCNMGGTGDPPVLVGDSPTGIAGRLTTFWPEF